MEIGDWQKSSLLSLEELTTEEIECILRQASKFKDEISNPKRQTDYLKGKRVVNLFLEPSTRTRIAFEIAAKTAEFEDSREPDITGKARPILSSPKSYKRPILGCFHLISLLREFGPL